jgi:hypothetical protein
VVVNAIASQAEEPEAARVRAAFLRLEAGSDVVAIRTEDDDRFFR